jgi:hypothetical protein
MILEYWYVPDELNLETNAAWDELTGSIDDVPNNLHSAILSVAYVAGTFVMRLVKNKYEEYAVVVVTVLVTTSPAVVVPNH